MEAHPCKTQNITSRQIVNCGTHTNENVLIDRRNETSVLLKMFPEEVWILILEHVETFLDFFNICSSSQLFLQLLQPLRVKVLFPGVFKILYKTNGINQTIPELRQVCRKWKRGVENNLQNLKESFMFKTDEQFSFSFVAYKHIPEKFSPVFRSSDQIANFEKKLAAYQCNPFITRHLFVQILDRSDNYLDELEEMLKNYGHHVWYCNLYVDVNSSSEQLKFYKSLIRMMTCLPNLKVLQVELGLGKYFCNTDIDKLKAYLQQNPVPNLCNLQFVYLHDVHPIVCETIFSRNLQIKSAETGRWDIPQAKQAPLKFLPNLQRFSAYAKSLAELQRIFPLELTAPLVKLNLILTEMKWVASPFGTLKELLPITLEELNIAMPSDWPSNVIKEKLNLPNLKKLAVKIHTCQGVDFILSMKNHLKELSIINYGGWGCFGQFDVGTVIKVYKHGYNLVESNIWTLMPKLQKLTLQGRCCTRVHFDNATSVS